MSKINNKEKFEKWIRVQIDYYLPLLGLQLNEIDIEFNEGTNYLEITASYPYLDPTIHYSEKVVINWVKGDVPKERILHELVHMITDPLYMKAVSRYVGKNEIEDERERLTDVITAIIKRL